MRRLLLITGSSVLLVFVAIVLISWSASSMADQKKGDGGKSQQGRADIPDNRHDEPDAIWSIPKVHVTIKPGQSTTSTVTLTVRDDLDPATVQITPTLAPYLTVLPTSTLRLRRGQAQIFKLTFSAKIGALPTTTDGVMLLRGTADERKANGRTRQSEAITPPLPIVIRIASTSTGLVLAGQTHIAVDVPEGWSVINDTTTNTSRLFSQSGATTDSDTPANVVVSVVPNTDGSSIQQFISGFRDGKFARYASSHSRLIAGQLSLVLDDRASAVSFDPLQAAIIPQGTSFIVISAYDMSASEFDGFMSSIRAQ